VTLSLRARLGPPLVACALAVLPCCGRGGALAASDAVRRSERVAVDGAELFLETRGADRRAPLLLWLHGGPGGAERPLFRYFNGDLEEHFVVAYWDQRGAGRSYDPEADPRRLTIARHLADLDLVVEHLRRSLGREKVVLIGHSWGTALGLLYSRAHPEKVSAFLGVAQVVSTREGQRAEHEFVAVEARRRGDAEAVERIREIGPPPYETATELLAIERLCERYGGVFHRAPSRAWVVIRAVLGGLVTPWEIPRVVRGNDVSLAAMHEELASLDLRRSVPEVAVPVFFLLGRHDRHVEAKLAARYFEALQAPVKRLIWFEDSAHNPPFEEPEAFDAAVVSALASIGVQAP
jgi:pimeloyl-ACP methyl ester carboxylesterase